MTADPLRLGIVGCGRMAASYLAACRLVPGVRVTAVTDMVLAQARRAAAAFGVPHATDRHEDLFDRVDAVAVLVPHHLHTQIGVAFLERGVAVLCEKPLALSHRDALAMVEAGKRGRAALGVSLMRRSYPSARLTRTVLALGLLGPIRAVDVEEGFVARRPAAAGWLYRQDQAGGGVLISNGIHALDLIMGFFGSAALRAYRDDGFAGVESNAELTLTFTATSPAIEAQVSLSLMRQLRNTIVITGERGTLEFSAFRPEGVTLSLSGAPAVVAEPMTLGLPHMADYGEERYFADQLAEFLGDVRAGRVGFTGGQHHLDALHLIDAAYASRRLMVHPWEAHEVSTLAG